MICIGSDTDIGMNRPGIQNMAFVATNNVSVAISQVGTSLPRSSHSFFPTTFFLVTMARFYFSLCIRQLIEQKTLDRFVWLFTDI